MTDWRKKASEEEKRFLEQLTSCYSKAERQYRCFATSFYMKEWMETCISKYLGEPYLSEVVFEGGYEEAERCVALCGLNPYEELYPISVVEIDVKIGIGRPLNHRDFLGALLGLGIERAKIGDIIIKAQGAYVVVATDLVDFIKWHLTGIGRYGKIDVKVIAFDEMILEAKVFKELSGTVASLRADSVFALGFGISRTVAMKLLEQEKGKLNGVLVKSSDMIKEGDIGTLKGYGKIRLTKVGKQTKKDRTHILIEKYT